MVGSQRRNSSTGADGSRPIVLLRPSGATAWRRANVRAALDETLLELVRRVGACFHVEDGLGRFTGLPGQDHHRWRLGVDREDDGYRDAACTGQVAEQGGLAHHIMAALGLASGRAQLERRRARARILR